MRNDANADLLPITVVQRRIVFISHLGIDSSAAHILRATQMLQYSCVVAMYRFDADELETMADGIAATIRKYSIHVEELTDKQVWEELQKKGYRFPVTGRRHVNIFAETAWWFEALYLAVQKVRKNNDDTASAAE